MAVATLGHLLALHVTPANHDDRAEVGRLAEAIQIATDRSAELAYVDQGYTGDRPAARMKATTRLTTKSPGPGGRSRSCAKLSNRNANQPIAQRMEVHPTYQLLQRNGRSILAPPVQSGTQPRARTGAL